MLRIVIARKERTIKAFFRCDQWVASGQEWTLRMELESVIQSEVSKKEKSKYSMLTHIYGI